MTVTMSIEEFDEFRDAHKAFRAVVAFLYKRVTYDYFDIDKDSDFWNYCKELSSEDVCDLLAMLQLQFHYSLKCNAKNIDTLKATTAKSG